MQFRKTIDQNNPESVEAAKLVRTNFQRIERREWWLWAAAFFITLLLTVPICFFLRNGNINY